MGVWSSLTDIDGRLTVPAGQCKSATQDCCQTVVCAPLNKLDIEPSDATGRMWSPLMIRCVLSGSGGVWVSDRGEMLVQMERPEQEECAV